MATKDVLGEYGQRVAARLLVEAGMEVLDRRWRCPIGGIDLVAVDPGRGQPSVSTEASGDCLVICEVVTRRAPSADSPVVALTPAKLARLRRLAATWLAGQQRSFADVRIDVVAVTVTRHGDPVLEHLRGVG